METRTAPVQSVVIMECRTDLRQPVKYTWSRQGGILPKSARVEGVNNYYHFKSNKFPIWIKLIDHILDPVEIIDPGSQSRRCRNLRLHSTQYGRNNGHPNCFGGDGRSTLLRSGSPLLHANANVTQRLHGIWYWGLFQTGISWWSHSI